MSTTQGQGTYGRPEPPPAHAACPHPATQRHHVDGDGDGVACETSSSGGSGGGSTGGGSGPSGSVSYKNCAAVRAAGKAPLHRGDPGYSRKLDRDGDGVACET